MSNRTSIAALVLAVAGAGAFAIYHSDAPASPRVPPVPAQKVETTAGMQDAPTSTLPPGHPAIGSRSGTHDEAPAPSGDSSPPAITWTPPSAWTVASNPSTMRLATYRVPRAAGDTEDTELSVVRAGGSPEANIERWIGQFDNAGKDTRASKTVRGMSVTEVEVHGTFMGGGMAMGAAAGSHPGWALIGAIVQTAGEPYFFKMTGPTRSVSAARPAFDALLASVTPTSS